jgi:hypothetical protein
MNKMMQCSRLIPVVVTLALASPVLGQSSANFKLDEHAFNAGGHPNEGVILTSASFKVSLDALGDGVARLGLTSSNFRMEAGLVASYPPPGEVRGFAILGDKQTMFWDPEPSVGVYNLYAGSLTGLTGSGNYGTCLVWDITGTMTADTTTPTAGEGRIYLVTAENRLAEEGPAGWTTGGSERTPAPPCP